MHTGGRRGRLQGLQLHMRGDHATHTSPTHRRKRLQSASSAAAATPSPSECSAAASAGTASLRARQGHGRGEGGVGHAAASAVRGVSNKHATAVTALFSSRGPHTKSQMLSWHF